MAARQSPDVAIIGGGIAGCASAYYLAKKGLAVTLLDKGELAGEQSGRTWGFVRQQLRDPLEIPLMIACKRLWRGLEAELEADIEWRQGGILHLAETDLGMAKYEAWLEHARTYQLDSRKVSGVSGLAAASRRAIMAFAEAAESCWAAMMWIKPEKPRGRRRRGGNP